MKYISSVLPILVLLHAGVSEGATDNWVFVTRYISPTGDKHDSDMYISKDRIKKLPNGNRVVRVLSTNYASGSEVASDFDNNTSFFVKPKFVHRSYVIVDEYDCMSEMHRVLSHLLYYSGPMASGKVWTATNINSLEEINQELKNRMHQWETIPKGSFGEKIMDSVCN
jgi:hypothetical protein